MSSGNLRPVLPKWFWPVVMFDLAWSAFGGATGSIRLMLRMPIAKVVFSLSLVAYFVLYIGDITESVFAALGAPQLLVLTLVVAIAAWMQWFSVRQLKTLAI